MWTRRREPFARRKPNKRRNAAVCCVVLLLLGFMFLTNYSPFEEEEILTEHDEKIQDFVEEILSTTPDDEGDVSSSCTQQALPDPRGYFPRIGEPNDVIEADLTSSEYKNFVEQLRDSDCSRTFTVNMSRPHGQFGSKFNIEILTYSFMGYMSRRSVVFTTAQSVVGRWCRFFPAINKCPPRDPATTYVVERTGALRDSFSTHFMVPPYEIDHIYMSYNDEGLLGPFTNLMTVWLESHNGKGDKALSLFRKFALYLWQFPQELLEQLEELKELLALPQPFVGVHIRWGDKFTEASPIPAEIYARYLKIMAEQENTKTIFVMSDSRKAVHQLKQLLPSYAIYTLTPPIWKGNNGTEAQARTLLQREGEARLLMLELSIMLDAKQVLCTMSSNVCRLSQVLRWQDPKTLIGIDEVATNNIVRKALCWLLMQFNLVEIQLIVCVEERVWSPW